MADCAVSMLQGASWRQMMLWSKRESYCHVLFSPSAWITVPLQCLF